MYLSQYIRLTAGQLITGTNSIYAITLTGGAATTVLRGWLE